MALLRDRLAPLFAFGKDIGPVVAGLARSIVNDDKVWPEVSLAGLYASKAPLGVVIFGNDELAHRFW